MSVRNKMIELRSDMSTAQVGRMSALIAKKLYAAVDWHGVSSMHIYRSVDTWKEVDSKVIADLIELNQPSVQVTTGSPHRYSSPPEDQFDLIVIPLLAFDADLNRLGFGGGWYDRFLAKQPNALKVGVAYDFQKIDQIEAHVHDVPLDIIITESTIFTR